MMKVKRRTELALVNLAVIGLAVVSYIGLSSIQSLYPFNGMVTDDRTPVFEWSGPGQGYELLLDEDADFDSPLTFDVSGRSYRLQQELDFGTYWWKVRDGDTESEARKFTVVSTVALSRHEKDTIINSGNTALLVHRSGLAGAVTLAVNQTLGIGEEENVKAEQEV